LKYMTRPLHFFGTFGALGIFFGSGISLFLAGLKVFTHQDVMDTHGPLFVVAGVLILAGIQMLAIGLLGELQVRHYHTSSHRAPYAIDRLVRLRAPEEPSMLQEG
jgi:hypothetical protein